MSVEAGNPSKPTTRKLKMSEQDKRKIKKNYIALVHDLPVHLNKILDYLYSHDIIDLEIKELIKAERAGHDQARKLLDTLPRCGPKAIPVFLESLQTYCPWLAETLQRDLPMSGHDKSSDEALSASLRSQLRIETENVTESRKPRSSSQEPVFRAPKPLTQQTKNELGRDAAEERKLKHPVIGQDGTWALAGAATTAATHITEAGNWALEQSRIVGELMPNMDAMNWWSSESVKDS